MSLMETILSRFRNIRSSSSPRNTFSQDIFNDLNLTRPRRHLDWIDLPAQYEESGVTLDIVSTGDLSFSGEDFDSLEDIEVIEPESVPLLSIEELRRNPNLNGQKRHALLGSENGTMKFIVVEIRKCYRDRTRAIKDILPPINPATLDFDQCGICIEPYAEATIPFEPNHEPSKMPKCGHVFGRDCIVEWLKNHDTCPLCRDELSLPVAYRLRVKIDEN
ncbi:uncharacterized protein EAF01_011259 [Botrytis porri]|uniref:RING-type domain-containing protein n=1 Tax=Botrytis porri TaxID=87229 RepID=A0A4Z1KZ53_9HELO|nr:uncharacterized protein EAF01_011259 [Botrytis porri]KAF7886581.1 hypothetical protein EAF01_011259 [Botrytis porri]TGO89756.1 hypothetical protein BPOR_0095g00170 [Botrytis porri]